MSQQASIWKLLSDKLDTTNKLLAALQPQQDFESLLVGPKFDFKSVDKQLLERLESFGGRLQRFKEGVGYGMSHTDDIPAGTSHAVNVYIKIFLKNPENSPAIVIVTKAFFTASVATRWLVESPIKPADEVVANLASAVRRGGGPGSSAKLRVTTSGTEPAQSSLLLSGRVAADAREEVEVGTVLPPNSSELFDIFMPVGTDVYHLGLEWFEMPLSY